MLREHRAYQDESITFYQKAFQAFTNDNLAYKKAQEEALKKAKGYQEKKNALAALGPPPEAPPIPRLTAGEPTFEGLFKLLRDGRPSMGLFSDEAGTFIGGHALNDDNKLKMAAGLSSLVGWETIGQGTRRRWSKHSSGAARLRSPDGATGCCL